MLNSLTAVILVFRMLAKQTQKLIATTKHSTSTKARIISLYGGTAVVGIWTFIRHITNGVNFDIVGQIGLAEQWAHGVKSGVVLGQTNYLLKMPLYFLANALHFISPMNRLLLLALIFNIFTFIFLFLIIEKMLNLQNAKDRSWFYLSMAWLATISGSVYWLEYANSRNLETAAGMLSIYLVLKYIKTGQKTTAAAIAVTVAITSFADPLQLYVCGGGVCLYLVWRWLRGPSRADSWRQMIIPAGAIFIGYLGGKILFIISKLLLPVSYLEVPNSLPPISFAAAIHSLHNVGINTLTIFGANIFNRPYGPNTIREALNLVVLTGIALLVVKLLKSKDTSDKNYGLLLSVATANFIVYIASGQALEPNTARYLIMIPLLVIVFVSLYGPNFKANNKLYWQQLWLGAILVSTVLLLGALIKSWPERHSKDQHIYQTVAYLQKNNFKYALGSHELGVTTTYFGAGRHIVLPVSCPAGQGVRAINLFYDRGQFEGLQSYSGEVPIILPLDTQQLGPNKCDRTKILLAFGGPKQEQSLPGIGFVEIYDSRQIKISN